MKKKLQTKLVNINSQEFEEAVGRIAIKAISRAICTLASDILARSTTKESSAAPARKLTYWEKEYYKYKALTEELKLAEIGKSSQSRKSAPQGHQGKHK